LIQRISAQPQSLAAQLRELAHARDLFSLLVERDVRTRYRQTILGVVWVVLQPLVPALIFAAVLGVFAHLPSDGEPYVLFALSGLVIYGLFSSSVARASTSFLRDGNLVTKVYFPRAVLPLAAGTGALVDFGVGSVVLLVLMLVLGQAPTIAVLAAPVIAAVTLAFGLMLGLGLAALTAHVRDFAIAVPFVMQMLLYASPIVYATTLVPDSLQTLYALNPMVPLVEAFRWSTLGGAPPSIGHITVGLASGGILVLASLVVFSRASRDLSDVI
jgi:lipopolysaccharide transport system permease protein